MQHKERKQAEISPGIFPDVTIENENVSYAVASDAIKVTIATQK